MKTIFLIMILIPLSVTATIDVQVVLISNENNGDGTGTMVLEMQAKSNNGDAIVDNFKAIIRDDNVVNPLSISGVFSDQFFTEPDYGVLEQFNSKSQYLEIVSQNQYTSGSEKNIDTMWNKIYTITINYNLSGGQTTSFTWATKNNDFFITRNSPNYVDYEYAGSQAALPSNVPLDPAPLPVELTKFTAKIIDEKVTLNWATATEVNNFGFEIQKQNSSQSNRNSEWENIGFVEGNGNSNSIKYYSFIDDRITSVGWYSYRLKQIDNDGTFKYSDIVEVNLTAPDLFELSQNYPNPFNPSTTITYSVRNAGNIRLIVYNLQGQVVKELVNEYKKPGFYSISFNGDQLASGIYYYKLISEGYQETKKMMLLK